MLFVYGSGVTGQARGLWLRDSGTLSFFFRNNPPDLYVPIPGGVTANRWHHVVGTYDGTFAFLDEEGERSIDVALPLADRGSPVGRHTADGSLVKAPLDEGFHTFRYLPGYRVTQRLVARGALGPLRDASGDALDDDGAKG